jgi:putative ABC transport system permease protein
MSDLLHDVRIAIRALRRQPGFAAAAVLTLALGIGATTAVFSVVYGILLRPLSFPQSDRLVRVVSLDGDVVWTASPPDFVDWRAQATSFQALAAVNTGSVALTGEGPARRFGRASITAAYFAVLGVAPQLGRGFTDANEVPGAAQQVVMSDAVWHTEFGAAPDIVGRSVRLDNEEYEVVGVMPRGFDAPGGVDFWVPLAFTADMLRTQRGAHYLDVYGRLAQGVTVDRADREMTEIAARLDAAYPDANPGWSARVTALRDALIGDVRQPLWALMGAVGLVLLMACVNVASLLLGRAVGREREHAIQATLGAGRLRLLRGTMVESGVLALAGGGIGAILAVWGVAALTNIAPGDLPRLGEVRVDGWVLGFTLLVTALTGLVFATAPSLHLLRHRERSGALAIGDRGGTAGGRIQRWRRALVVVQMALAVTLVAGAGLLGRSFGRLLATDPGFDVGDALAFSLSVPDAGYEDPARVETFVADVEERLAALPGVTAVGSIFGLPLTGFDFSISITSTDGRTFDSAEQERRTSPQMRIVTPGYFAAMGIPVLRGRGITEHDRNGSPPVVVVSETAARMMFGGDDPLGHRFELGTRMGLGRGRVGGEVVGVVGDVKDVSLRAAPRPLIYAVHRQFPVGFLQVVLRTTGDPRALAEPARRVVAGVDPNVPLYRVQTLGQLVRGSVAQARFLTVVLGLCATVALALAAIGIYGVVAYAVAQRTRELGIRLALGARAADILWLVLRQGAMLGGLGAALGLAAALLATRALGRLLYQVAPTDPITFGLGTLGLLVVALLASYLPARRAAGVDPVEALRHE